jgi:predicted nucleic acid-binding protein
MRICVDTSILIDILKDEYRPFQELLYTAISNQETLVIPPVVFAELLPQFKGNNKEAALFLREHKVQIEPLDLESAISAGRSWMDYLKRKTKPKCPVCGNAILLKEHVLSDFYIGGFAVTHTGAILTRDRGIYRSYFPKLKGYGGCLDKKAIL